MATTAIFGAGVMGETLLSGLLRSGRDAADLVITERNPDRAAQLAEKYHVRALSNPDAAELADTLVLVVKPQDMEAARRHLLKLSGKTHQLNSAAVLARNGETIWRHVGVARLTMRQLDPGFVGRHLARVGPVALNSVGAYQIEGEGIQLFEKVEGDHFTIVGLPLMPLLKELRELGAIDG